MARRDTGRHSSTPSISTLNEKDERQLATQRYTAMPRAPKWQDRSAQHASGRERLESALRDFHTGQGTPAKSIVGAYGSGKSELMAWGFRYAWKELGLPAIYINLEILLKHLPAHMGPAAFVDEVQQFLDRQLTGIRESLLSDHPPPDIHLAPDLRGDERLIDYFRSLFADENLHSDRIHQALSQDKCVLFLDEIEQKYRDLLAAVQSSDQAPLREVLQKIEQGLIPFYLVMSFASAQFRAFMQKVVLGPEGASVALALGSGQPVGLHAAEARTGRGAFTDSTGAFVDNSTGHSTGAFVDRRSGSSVCKTSLRIVLPLRAA